MKWTEEPPTSPGLYAFWFEDGRGDDVGELVRVTQGPSGLFARAHGHQSWNGQLVKDLAGAWWSDEPLPELPLKRR